MKKSLFIAAALLSLVACTREVDIEVPTNNVTLIARTETSADTKTVVEGETHVFWEPGDEIAVFSGGKSGKFTTDITESSATATFHGSLGETNGADLWAVYPYSKDAVFDGETITTTLPSEQVARFGSFGKDMNLSIARSSSNNLQFYNVGGGIRFRLTQEGIKRVVFEGYGGETLAGKVRIGFDENGLPVVREVTDGSKAITLLPPSGNDSFPTNVWFYCVAIPGSLSSGYKLEFYRDTEYSRMASEKAVTIKRSIYGSIDNADEGCEFIPIPNTITTPEIVDLGLSVKWASFNLGASKPEEYGNYYAWGETQTKINYSWSTYKWCNGDYDKLTKYCNDPSCGDNGFTDTKTILDPEDDAAHVNLGSNWRMPTDAEWTELRENCTWTLTSDYQGSGIVGWVVTSNISGFETNSIFLPAAGYWYDDALGFVSLRGYYWSSSLYLDDLGAGCAWVLQFGTGSSVLESVSMRFFGQSVRPVYDDSIPQVPIPDPVDMGLSVKWSSFNLGATKPEEYGDYYAWGETVPKREYTWGTYKWCNGSEDTLTKYCTDSSYGYDGFIDGKTFLDLEDDAAHVALGGKWRMPTKAEFEELGDNSSISWAVENGINGYRFTSNMTGNSIFLPAAGAYYFDYGLVSSGISGFYWASSISESSPYNAWGMGFNSSLMHNVIYADYRSCGISIRPVYAE